MPLFGGRRAVWVKAGSRNFAAAVEAVVASPPTDCRIVIEAGDLRRTAPVRAICEKAKCAAVLPCYVDTERDLIRLVDDEMREARLTIAPDARAALVSLIGGDRQASRSEIRKLALYAHGKDRVTLGRRRSRSSPTPRRWRSTAWWTRPSPAAPPETEAQFSKAMAAGTSAGHDHVVGAALRDATAQGAPGARRRRRHLRRDAKLHSADPFPPRGMRSRPRSKAWTAPRLERAMEQLAETALSVAAHRRAFGVRWRNAPCSRLRCRRAARSGDSC